MDDLVEILTEMRVRLLIMTVLGSSNVFLIGVEGSSGKSGRQTAWDIREATSIQIDSDGFNPPYTLTVLALQAQDSPDGPRLLGGQSE